ncbi:hypothetical protein FRC01_004147 [Tulasnella sp. 417]|nr:hypothetical protein FRC01_004147 [Tulasnella sp. 417]
MQLYSLFVAAFAAVGALAQDPGAVPDPSINTPTGVIQCLPVQLTFSGTSPPFIITIHPGGQADAAPLTTVGTTSETTLTWIANLPPNANYTCVIRDSIGRTNPSAPFEIYPGSTTNCPAPTAAQNPAPLPGMDATGTRGPPKASSPKARKPVEFVEGWVYAATGIEKESTPVSPAGAERIQLRS